MMFTHKNLMTVCCAAVLAFGLAACGSSSDDVKVMDTVVDKKPLTPVVPEDQPPTVDEIAATTMEAATKATAIGEEAAQTEGDADADADAGLGGTGAMPTTEDQRAGEYNLAIKHGETSITVEGATKADDVEFMQAMDFGDGRTMHVLKMDADEDGNVVEEVVIVSTDIDEPTDIPFVKPDEDSKGRYTFDDGEEFLTFSDEVHGGLAMLTDSRVVVPGPGGSVTLMGGDDNKYSGTFDGAEGTFTCTDAGGCEVTVVDGEITNMLTVHFTPDDEDVMVKEDDADYLNYGFWLKRTTDEDGVLTYNEVETFAGSSIAVSGGVSLVEGTAEYDGGATGVYVKNVYNTDRTIASATSGFFTANVNLMAYFGDDDFKPSQVNTVTGTIDQFVLQYGEDNMWEVVLDGAIAPSEGTASGTADGGGDPGSFNATFHGDVMEVEDVVPKPSSVVGEFNANFNDGTAAGGFGARTQ